MLAEQEIWWSLARSLSWGSTLWRFFLQYFSRSYELLINNILLSRRIWPDNVLVFHLLVLVRSQVERPVVQVGVVHRLSQTTWRQIEKLDVKRIRSEVSQYAKGTLYKGKDWPSTWRCHVFHQRDQSKRCLGAMMYPGPTQVDHHIVAFETWRAGFQKVWLR